MAGEGGQLRTQDQIENALLRAKLKISDVLPVSQILCTSAEEFNAERYRLVQLDVHLLQTLKTGQKIAFKGEDDENVMLCTETRSYDIRECETSNSLLLVKNLKFSQDVKDIEDKMISKIDIIGQNYKYIEVFPSKPSLNKIVKLLNSTKYQGPELEYMIDQNSLLTYDQLLNKAQASDIQLKECLNKLNTVTISEKIRILDFSYHFRVLSFMLKSIDENSWEFDEINENETVSSWKEIVSEEILKQLFHFYTQPSKVVDGVQLYQYDVSKVCRSLAEMLLLQGGSYDLEEFDLLWNESVPEGMVPAYDMLYGIAIIDKKKVPHKIIYFPESKLPETIDERFQALFNVKPKWIVPEITPYIQCFTTDKLDANAILAKHARASTIDGVRYYSTKYV